MTIDQGEALALKWPLHPYKGLNYYGPEDVAIFAGRDRDIERCSRLISSPSTRVLILHGTTGSGKSSFLRAGLIPFLERHEHGYRFVKKSEGDAATALFVRATHDPMSQLCEAVFAFSRTPRTTLTPLGPELLDLSDALFGTNDLGAFGQMVASDSGRLVESLSKVASKLPETLIIIVDQVEEVLTLKPGAQGDSFRHAFFRFLRSFGDANIDMKILLAIRTEFFGRILDEIRASLTDTSGIDDYFLRDLNEDQLVEAIERPTLNKPIGRFGVPREHYKFWFSSDLPRRIAQQLQRAVPAGGVLPVMQIVCDRLYRSQRDTTDSALEITYGQFQNLGGIEGQIEAHLAETLHLLCYEAELPEAEHDRELSRWRKVLLSLVRTQIDGTITTEVRTTDELKERARRAGCKVDFETAVELLSSPSSRIIRSVGVYNVASGSEIPCFALGHDAIGIVLKAEISDHRVINLLKRLINSLAIACLASAILFALLYTFVRADPLLFALSCLYVVLGVLLKLPIFNRAPEQWAKFIDTKRIDPHSGVLTILREIMRIAAENRAALRAREVENKPKETRPPVSPVLEPEKFAVLKAASLMSTRTFTGIYKDAGLPRHVAIAAVTELLRGGDLELTTSRRTGSARYKITAAGIERLNREMRTRG
jgi:hypothetical protein